MSEENHITVSWDTCDVTQHEADYLREQNPKLTEDEAFTEASEDQDLIQREWDDMIEDLTEQMKEIRSKFNDTDTFAAIVENFGWQNKSGWKEFDAEDGGAFLREVLPDTDCTFKIIIEEDRIRITNSHHDGTETYTIFLIDDDMRSALGKGDPDASVIDCMEAAVEQHRKIAKKRAMDAMPKIPIEEMTTP